MLHSDHPHGGQPGTPAPLKRRIAAFAARQGGVISRRQLQRGGVSSRHVEGMIRRGDLWRLHPGVYAVGRPDVPPYGQAWAAILATRGHGKRPNARALTGRAGLAALGVCPWPPMPRVLVAGKALEIPGLAIVRTRHLASDEVRLDGRRLPMTVWWLSMLHATTETTTYRQIETLLSRSERAKVLDVPSLVAALDAGRGRGRDGIPRLRRTLRPYTGLDDAAYASLLERLGHLLARDSGLPEPEVNAPLLLGNDVLVHIDLYLRDLRIAIELDGRDTHQRAREFQNDRERDRELLKLGITPLRFTWWDVDERPEVVPRDVRAVIARRGAPS